MHLQYSTNYNSFRSFDFWDNRQNWQRVRGLKYNIQLQKSVYIIIITLYMCLRYYREMYEVVCTRYYNNILFTGTIVLLIGTTADVVASARVDIALSTT